MFFFFVVVVSGSLFGILKLKEYIDKKKEVNLSGLTEGEYLYMNEVKEINNTRRGSFTSTKYFEVNYKYNINGLLFLNSSIIYNNSNNTDFINKLRRGENKKLHIRYNIFHPQESDIVVY